ncbi:MAG TPA: DUF4037 domain-containing protein, partial [Anaerolineae bacterium]
ELIYSAARLDFGSDVLGFDTPQSMDHDWGPKCTLFVAEHDYDACRERIPSMMGWELPYEVAGFPTHYSQNDNGTRNNEPATGRPIRHAVTVTTPTRFFTAYLGVDPARGLRALDWLAIPQQRLRTIQSGRVFHDGLSQLDCTRQNLCWYSHDVWLYLMANQWQRISQEAPFMARCGDLGDELGSRVIAMRLVRELMRLCFMIERQYAPYIKWFGTAFSRLRSAETLSPIFARVLSAADWQAREEHLSAAYTFVAQLHNSLGITPEQEVQVVPFYSRRYLVPQSDRIVEALHAAIVAPEVRNLPPHIGSIDQFVDSTDILDTPERCKRLTVIYAE